MVKEWDCCPVVTNGGHHVTPALVSSWSSLCQGREFGGKAAGLESEVLGPFAAPAS